MKRLICGHQFALVATIEPEREAAGRVREFSPRGAGGHELSDAPFCRFAFPAGCHGAGVYAVLVNDRVVYVGKTNNLSRRWGPGEYGDIVVPEPGSPQVTNRRVNHGILDAARGGDVVQVWFHKTNNRDAIEAEIIGKLDLPWNREAPNAVAARALWTARSARDHWPSAIRGAEAAKAMFRRDRAEGESLFEALLAAYPDDGMVYLKRAEAYEYAGDRAAAAADYARAADLLPFPSRKAEARAGLHRTRGAG